MKCKEWGVLKGYKAKGAEVETGVLRHTIRLLVNRGRGRLINALTFLFTLPLAILFASSSSKIDFHTTHSTQCMPWLCGAMSILPDFSHINISTLRLLSPTDHIFSDLVVDVAQSLMQCTIM